MKIIVYGLGIIGASCAMALKKAGYTVYGKNRSRAALDYALEQGMIDGAAENFDGADVVILALPPEAIVSALEENYPDGCIVSDVCGVKRLIERAAYQKERNYFYVGMHPMAGKETSGIRSASATLFQGKNLILIRNEKTNSVAFETVKRLGKDMGFKKIVTAASEEHDRKIALTSQLAHIVSSAYIQSPVANNVEGFTGGSFQDMTRVGGVDVSLWLKLYFENSDYLQEELAGLISRLKEYETALKTGDEEKMKALLTAGGIAHKRFYREE